MKASSRPRLFVLLWAACGLAVPGTGQACKYNVRDAGFVDWDPAPYRLLALANAGTSSNHLDTLKHLATASLLEANVQFQVLRADEQPAHPDLRLFATRPTGAVPSLFLVGPDERCLSLSWATSTRPFQDQAWAAVESVVSSPARDALLGRLIETYAVVLLAEGSDATQNRRARQAIDAAIESIGSLVDRLPKPIDAPPRVQVLPHADLAREEVLLWSLGLEERDLTEPNVAVLYGRGRLIGPVLRGGLITQAAVYQALAILGQDCECDLDRAWMRGRLLPGRWTRDLQVRARKQLGFDAENPMVKTEVSRIMARGPSSAARTVGLPGGSDGLDLLGYREIRVDELPETAPLSSPASPAAGPARPALPPPPASSASPSSEGLSTGPFRWAILALSGIVAVALLGGGWLLWSARRRG